MIRWLARLTESYLLGLFGWALMRASFGDRWWWLFVLNTFAIYLFAPLPAAVGVATLARSRWLWLKVGAALALAGACFGALWLPRLPRHDAAVSGLSVMTFNMLGFNQRSEATIAAVRAANADIVALQELNISTAEALATQLGDLYPYQILNPRLGVTGMGVISRYPLQAIATDLPGDWIGNPQAILVNFSGTPVVLLNIHTRSTDISSADREGTIREREHQAETIAAFAATRGEPLIVLGDFNTSDQSVAYTTVTQGLRDAWREVGAGLGHTFPGAASPGSSRHSIAGVAVPMWLIRIDYVFHSTHWQTLEAGIGPWDGVSDHRPVLVRLALRRSGAFIT
jgi:vancomycin resistance protein VanJ